MSQPTIHTVVFDLGGVLIDWNPEYVYRQIFEDEAERRYFLTEVCSPHWNEQQDAGRTLQEATEWLVERFPDYESQIRAYYGRWQEMLGGAIPETVEILNQLREQNSHRLLALTNWSAETFPTALEMFDFLHHFEGILVSGHEKLIKPDPRIYHLLIERYGLNPGESLFIDDNPRNVEGARAVGLQAVHFQSPRQLREDLSVLGIL
ncbi:MAG: HAD family phosphatase [Saprospiraceae bacterium]|jgi:2-haloacid dehalogenase|nr:HAD family phosphatase [Saprospiraceae bacterium]